MLENSARVAWAALLTVAVAACSSGPSKRAGAPSRSATVAGGTSTTVSSRAAGAAAYGADPWGVSARKGEIGINVQVINEAEPSQDQAADKDLAAKILAKL